MSRWQSSGYRLPLVMALALAAYANSLSGSFQFDDFNVIVAEPTVHSLGAWWANVGHGIRPLLKLSYALNWSVDSRATGFHVVNVVIHLANTLLVWGVARRVARLWPHADLEFGAVTAATAAMLFALHPAATEAVTYVSGRSSSLMATFYLASCLAYMAGTDAAAPSGARLLSPILFAAALATKESAVSLPLVLLAWEGVRPNRAAWPDVARRLVPHLAVLGCTALLLIAHPIYGHRLMPDLHAGAICRNALLEIHAVAYLLGRAVGVYPANIDPDLRMSSLWTPTLIGQAALLLALLAVTIVTRRSRPWIAFGLLWWFAELAPTNSLLPRPDLANDRQIYLAAVGLWIAIGIEAAALWSRLRQGRCVVDGLAITLMATLALLTIERNRDYESEVRLWETTVRQSPLKARGYVNLGFAYAALGRRSDARMAYETALRLDPGRKKARDNLEALNQTPVR